VAASLGQLDLEEGLRSAHPAGDALLVRLATALEQAMAGHGGNAYRLGGDEFCIRPRSTHDRAGAITAAACQAVTAHRGGFHITASYGTVLLPEESQDVTEAMQLVGQRIYAQKTGGRRSPNRQSRDVLLRALQEHTPELAGPHAAAAKLVGSTHERLDGGDYPDGWPASRSPWGRAYRRLRRLHRRDLPRPHAPRRTIPDAVAELRRVAGSRFDPAVVDAFSEQVVELVWPSAPAPARVSGGAR
jgi:Diguanylate cyclase, GGDEF domain